MVVYILNSKIKKRDYDGIVLSEHDFHPCHPFFISHPSIKPESVDRIVIKGIFERCKYKRAVLRYCDYMLSKGGVLEIFFYNLHFENSLYVRARNDWQYELSLVFGTRILLKEQNKSDENGYFKYEKIGEFLPEGDTIDKWTFGIVSSGRMNDRVMEMIHQIESQKIPNYEVVICGPAPSSTLPSCVRVLSDEGMYPDIRIPISRKKNYIIDEARYNNIVMMHDRYSIPTSWYLNMKKFGNYFDILVNRVVDENDHKQRMYDWGWHYPNPFPNRLKDVWFERYGRSDYNEWSDNVYIPGGFFIFKKHFGLKLNPECNWGEKEDVDFCRRAYNMGLLIEIDSNNTVYSIIVRTKWSDHKFLALRKILISIKVKIVTPFKFYIEKIHYLNYIRSL